MGPAPPDSSDRETRVDRIVAQYLRDAETGRTPDRDQLIARHADLAGELRSFFADRDRIERVARPFREGASPSPFPCPDCHGRLEPDGTVASCPACGSRFRLERGGGLPPGERRLGRFELRGAV